MNNGFRRIYLLTLLTTLLLLSTVNSSDGKWDIKIELSKQKYLLHEPVVLDVTLTNNTSDTLRAHSLFPPNHYKFYIFLADSDGKEMKYTGIQANVVWGPGELLLAGEQDYACFNVLELFGLRDSNSGYKVSWMWFPYIVEGTYTVVAEYEGDPSNELTFNVVEPYGQEEKALRKIEQASQIWSQAETDPSSRAYGEIVRDYPNSVYAEECYHLSRFFSQEIFGEYGSGTYDKRTLDREMLAKYPNSANVKGRMLSLTHMKNEDEQIAIYDELIAENPNTRCSKIAGMLKKRLLAKRERGE